MFEPKDQKQAEKNRVRMLNIVKQIPVGCPTGWEEAILAIGGLMCFSEIHTDQIVCISLQHQSVINCNTGEKRYVEELYDENDLIAYLDGIEREQVHIAGEGLRHYTTDGNIVEQIAPAWPKEQIVFIPNWCSCWSSQEDCRIVWDGYELKAYGFNKTGDIFVIATSADLTIYKKSKCSHHKSSAPCVAVRLKKM